MRKETKRVLRDLVRMALRREDGLQLRANLRLPPIVNDVASKAEMPY